MELALTLILYVAFFSAIVAVTSFVRTTCSNAYRRLVSDTQKRMPARIRKLQAN